MTTDKRGSDTPVPPPAVPSVGERVSRALARMRGIEVALCRGDDPARVCQLVARALGEFALADAVIISPVMGVDEQAPPVALWTSPERPINARALDRRLAADQVAALAPGGVLSLAVPEEIDRLAEEEGRLLTALGARRALVIPLTREGHQQGRVDVLCARPLTPTQVELDLCQQVAGYAATALALGRAAAARDEADNTEMMLAFSESLRQAPLDNPSELLQAIVALLPRVLGCDRAYAYLWHAERHEFLPTATENLSEEQVATLKQHPMNPRAAPLFEQLLYATRPLVIVDAAGSTMLPPHILAELGAQSLMALPLRGRRQQTLGAILLDLTTQERTFAPAQVALASRLTEQVQALVENAVLYEAASQRSDRLAVLNEIGIYLASLSDLSAIFPALHAQLATVVDATALFCALSDPEDERVSLYHMSQGVLSIRHDVDLENTPLLARAFAERQGSIRHMGGAALVNEVLGETQALPAESVICVPMRMRHEHVIGILAVYSLFNHAYSADDVEFLATVASQTAVAIDNARLYGQLQATGDLRGQLLDRIMSAHELERKNIVDDIHDDTLQAMVSSMYKIDLCLRLSETANHQREHEELRDLRGSLAGNIDRLRSLIFGIRPSTLDMLGLLPTLDNYLEQMENETGIQAHFRSQLGSRLESGMETLVYRLLQELLSNVRKHSQASVALIVLERIDFGLRIEVTDDGIGFVPEDILSADLPLEGNGIGLALVRERVRVAGGIFRLDSAPGEGTRIEIILPMTAARHITGPLNESRLERGGTRSVERLPERGR